MLEQLESKMKDLAQKLEQSAAAHNGMIGAMGVLKELYADAVKAAPVVEAIDPALTPVIEGVEAVVNDL